MWSGESLGWTLSTLEEGCVKNSRGELVVVGAGGSRLFSPVLSTLLWVTCSETLPWPACLRSLPVSHHNLCISFLAVIFCNYRWPLNDAGVNLHIIYIWLSDLWFLCISRFLLFCFVFLLPCHAAYGWGFPGAQVVKNPPASEGDVRDVGSISEWGRSPGGGHGNPLQYSGLENTMDRNENNIGKLYLSVVNTTAFS